MLHRFQTAIKRDDTVEVGGITRGKVRTYSPAATPAADGGGGRDGAPSEAAAAAASAPASAPAKRGPPELSVHVSPTAAVAISGGLDNECVPSELRELLSTGEVTWRPRLRIGTCRRTAVGVQ